MKLTDNTLLVDNVSEALYECIKEGAESFSMLVCEVIDKYGLKCQVHITVTYSENDFIDNDEEMPVLSHDDQYRLKEIELKEVKKP
jgi:hypothetical protein